MRRVVLLMWVLIFPLVLKAQIRQSVLADALSGYSAISQAYGLPETKQYITIIDFDLPSTQERLWVYDVANDSILLSTHVAHGRNTGVKKAEVFSNKPNSYQSSLGFYLTGETYRGKNGYSLRLDGLEKGVNDNARVRNIVMHGANYAEQPFIKKHGRLGRSFGCPAVPRTVNKELIDLIKGKTVLFIYHSSRDYQRDSKYISRVD
ncbi:murein L,D-transpeptidase catalytic domain family protein [Roseivirga pacifica]|uniref:murein L,D-transpeptidase catalytic domain family protein n=1 Tax=Roseivirga pacifica TaxID=1267423 RepID=UPI00227BCEB0|nr:murein L,D-transpeptidase catalytic domain family protein [Roseivirga pacifica]